MNKYSPCINTEYDKRLITHSPIINTECNWDDGDDDDDDDDDDDNEGEMKEGKKCHNCQLNLLYAI
ncbi:hypothetical protein LOAG_14567 [Loa loa]|uniref:Uncharacterized protein n=1 Tax=Loa loa TaxID=7209 RepID=A0A1S0THJ5_LOALO|nr:hypothetical protein LOAG_14567 [Loa loa]EFO13960.1 hypothetical protein LOAG_14567 [Loa loa]